MTVTKRQKGEMTQTPVELEDQEEKEKKERKKVGVVGECGTDRGAKEGRN